MSESTRDHDPGWLSQLILGAFQPCNSSGKTGKLCYQENGGGIREKNGSGMPKGHLGGMLKSSMAKADYNTHNLCVCLLEIYSHLYTYTHTSNLSGWLKLGTISTIIQ